MRMFLSLAPAVIALLLAGCGHSIRGYVVRGDVGGVDWLESGAVPDGEPVGGAAITITRDPLTMSREVAGTATSADDGSFSLPVAGFGAGWMDEEWRIDAVRGRVGSATWIGPLPSGGRILYIVLGPEHRDSTQSLWEGQLQFDETSDSLLEEVKRYR